MQYKIAPYYAGQQPFGDVAYFVWNQLDGTGAIDAWLGLTPGTTVYNNCLTFGLSGQFLDTLPNVLAQQATLRGFANMVSPLGLPTQDHFPANFRWWPNVRLLSTEMQFG